MTQTNDKTAGWPVTRPGWILGLAMVAWAAFMNTHLSYAFGDCNLERGLTRPMLAMEVAASTGEVKTILSDLGSTCDDVCQKKIKEMRIQQSYDRVFIILYTTFFLYLMVLSFVRGNIMVKLAGFAAGALSLIGAWFDWAEDNAILQALTFAQAVMRDPSYHKWLFLSLATACLIPLFFSWTTKSLALWLLRMAIVLSAFGAALVGVNGFRHGQDLSIQTAALSIATTQFLVVIFLWTVQIWKEGTHAALDHIANWPVLHVIADWPPDDQATDFLEQHFPDRRARLKNVFGSRSYMPRPRQ